MYSRLLAAALAAASLGTAHAAELNPQDTLARLEPYNYPARYIAAFETNTRQPVELVNGFTVAPLAAVNAYAANQQTLAVQKQALGNYQLLKLGYVWIVAVSPEAKPEAAAQTFQHDLHDLIDHYCDPDPTRVVSKTENSGRYTLAGTCRSGNTAYTELTADPIGDFSVLPASHRGGSLVSWVIAQATSLQMADIGDIRKKLPPGYYMIFADTLKNRATGTEQKLVRIYKDGDERGYPMPRPPAFN